MSKIITITLGTENGDEPTQEGWIILGYSAPEGGRTDIGAVVKRKADGSMPSWADVATILHGGLGRSEWPQEIRGAVSGNRVRLSVPDVLDPIVFSAGWNPSLDQSAKVQRDPAFITIAEEKF